MPRIRQLADQYAQSDFIREINARSAWEGMEKNDDLGKALGVTGQSIGNYKRDPGRIQLKTMQKLVKALKPNPAIVLRFLGYSNQEIRKFAKETLSG